MRYACHSNKHNANNPSCNPTPCAYHYPESYLQSNKWSQTLSFGTIVSFWAGGMVAIAMRWVRGIRGALTYPSFCVRTASKSHSWVAESLMWLRWLGRSKCSGFRCSLIHAATSVFHHFVVTMYRIPMHSGSASLVIIDTKHPEAVRPIFSVHSFSLCPRPRCPGFPSTPDMIHMNVLQLSIRVINVPAPVMMRIEHISNLSQFSIWITNF